MYKTREEVEAMIEIVEYVKLSLEKFGLWIVYSLSTPKPGVLHTEFCKEDDKETT